MLMSQDERVTQDENPAPRWPLVAVAGLSLFTVVLILTWVLNAGTFNHWLGVHTGATNESGPYYGFWSGFGSDLAEFGILGAIGTATGQRQGVAEGIAEPGNTLTGRRRPDPSFVLVDPVVAVELDAARHKRFHLRGNVSYRPSGDGKGLSL